MILDKSRRRCEKKIRKKVMKKYSPKKNSVSAVIITVFSAVLFPLFTLEKNSLITATENLSQYSERNLFLLEARDFEVVFIVYRIPCL